MIPLLLLKYEFWGIFYNTDCCTKIKHFPLKSIVIYIYDVPKSKSTSRLPHIYTCMQYPGSQVILVIHIYTIGIGYFYSGWPVLVPPEVNISVTQQEIQVFPWHWSNNSVVSLSSGFICSLSRQHRWHPFSKDSAYVFLRQRAIVCLLMRSWS